MMMPIPMEKDVEGQERSAKKQKVNDNKVSYQPQRENKTTSRTDRMEVETRDSKYLNHEEDLVTFVYTIKDCVNGNIVDRASDQGSRTLTEIITKWKVNDAYWEHPLFGCLTKDAFNYLLVATGLCRLESYTFKLYNEIQLNPLSSFVVPENVTSVHHKDDGGMVINYVEPFCEKWYNPGANRHESVYVSATERRKANFYGHFVTWKMHSLVTDATEKIVDFIHNNVFVLDLETNSDTQGTMTPASQACLQLIKDVANVVFDDLYATETKALFAAFGKNCYFLNDDMPLEQGLDWDNRTDGLLLRPRRMHYGDIQLDKCRNHHYKLTALSRMHDRGFSGPSGPTAELDQRWQMGHEAMVCSTNGLFSCPETCPETSPNNMSGKTYLCKDCIWANWCENKNLSHTSVYGTENMPIVRCKKHLHDTLPAFCQKNEEIADYIQHISGVPVPCNISPNLDILNHEAPWQSQNFLGLPSNIDWIKNQATELNQRQHMLHNELREQYVKSNFTKEKVLSNAKLKEVPPFFHNVCDEYCLFMKSFYKEGTYLRSYDMDPDPNLPLSANMQDRQKIIRQQISMRQSFYRGPSYDDLMNIFNNPLLLKWYLDVLPFDIYQVDDDYNIGFVKETFHLDNMTSKDYYIFLFYVEFRGKRIVFVDKLRNKNNFISREEILSTTFTKYSQAEQGKVKQQLVLALLIKSPIQEDDLHNLKQKDYTTNLKVRLYPIELMFSKDIDKVTEVMPYDAYAFHASGIDYWLEKNVNASICKFPTPFQIRNCDTLFELWFVSVRQPLSSQPKITESCIHIHGIDKKSIANRPYRVSDIELGIGVFCIKHEIKVLGNFNSTIDVTQLQKHKKPTFHGVRLLYNNRLVEFMYQYFVQHIEIFNKETTYFKEVYCSTRRSYFIHDTLTVLENGLHEENGQLMIVIQPIGTTKNLHKHSATEYMGKVTDPYYQGKKELFPTFFLTVNGSFKDLPYGGRNARMMFNGSHKIGNRNHSFIIPKNLDRPSWAGAADPRQIAFSNGETSYRDIGNGEIDVISDINVLLKARLSYEKDIHDTLKKQEELKQKILKNQTVENHIFSNMESIRFAFERPSMFDRWCDGCDFKSLPQYKKLVKQKAKIESETESLKKELKKMEIEHPKTCKTLLDKFRQDSQMEIPNARNIHFELAHGSFRFFNLPRIAFIQSDKKHGVMCYMPHWPTLSTLPNGHIVCMRGTQYERLIKNQNMPISVYEKQWFRRGYVPVQIAMEGKPDIDNWLKNQANATKHIAPLHVTAAVNYYPFRESKKYTPLLEQTLLLNILKVFTEENINSLVNPEASPEETEDMELQEAKDVYDNFKIYDKDPRVYNIGDIVVHKRTMTKGHIMAVDTAWIVPYYIVKFDSGPTSHGGQRVIHTLLDFTGRTLHDSQGRGKNEDELPNTSDAESNCQKLTKVKAATMIQTWWKSFLKCPTCFDFYRKDKTTTLPCHHTFCTSCLNTWTNTKYDKNCPCCRRPIPDKYIAKRVESASEADSDDEMPELELIDSSRFEHQYTWRGRHRVNLGYRVGYVNLGYSLLDIEIDNEHMEPDTDPDTEPDEPINEQANDTEIVLPLPLSQMLDINREIYIALEDQLKALHLHHRR